MTDGATPDVAVIGAGPAGLMAAEVLAKEGVRVTVFDAMPSAGRKFLMAGRGGLNLTHGEALPALLARYGAAAPVVTPAIAAFAPDALRAWSDELGQPTFVGSSGRVFPQAFKASPLLRAWLQRLAALGVSFAFRHRWTGWCGETLTFDTPAGDRDVNPRATVLALGGASWPRLGSDGAWVNMLADKGVAITSLRPANCGFIVAWSDLFSERFAGHPLKGVDLSFGSHHARGEVTITRGGIEGGAVYGLSAVLRDAVTANGEAIVHVALRPDLDRDALVGKLALPRRKQSLSTFLRKALHLSPVAIALLHEAAIAVRMSLSSLPSADMAALINAVPLKLIGPAPLARAISTAGGIAFDELDDRYMIRKLPGVFAAGEMLDWEAPTGGYLLQASFSTGASAGRGALKWLGDFSANR